MSNETNDRCPNCGSTRRDIFILGCVPRHVWHTKPARRPKDEIATGECSFCGEPVYDKPAAHQLEAAAKLGVDTHRGDCPFLGVAPSNKCPCQTAAEPAAPPTSEGEPTSGPVEFPQAERLKINEAFEVAQNTPVQPVSPSAEQEAREWLVKKGLPDSVIHYFKGDGSGELSQNFGDLASTILATFYADRSASLRERIVELEKDVDHYAKSSLAWANAATDWRLEVEAEKAELQARDSILDEEGVARSCISPREDLRKVCRDLKAAEASLSALKLGNAWRCFFCDFVTAEEKEAAAHFGDRDDAEEFKPICKWWARMDDAERREALQDTIQQLNAAQLGNEEKAREIAEVVVQRYIGVTDPRRAHHKERIYLIARRVLDGGKG